MTNVRYIYFFAVSAANALHLTNTAASGWRIHPSLKNAHKQYFASTYRAKMLAQIEELMQPWYSNGRPYVDINTLRSMGSRGFKFLSCAAYYRIIDGEVFFMAQSRDEWYSNARANLVALSLQDAVDTFNMSHITTELLINTCDHPISMSNQMAIDRAGYPIFSPHYGPYALDMPYPDPVDLSARYTIETAVKPWKEREPKAAFRGSSNNYPLNEDYNWRASPRFRLQRLSEEMPELVDAAVTKWLYVAGSGKSQYDLINQIEYDGYAAHQERLLPLADIMNNYKYNVVVEGALGDGRLCGVMLSGSVPIVQEFLHVPFFMAALENGSQILSTDRYFEDLPELLSWANKNDHDAYEISVNARTVAAPLVCSWEGRLEYWAALLEAWDKAVINPELIDKPSPSLVNDYGKKVTYPKYLRWNDTSTADKWQAIWSARACSGENCGAGFHPQGDEKGTWNSARQLPTAGAERPALLSSLGALKL